MRPCAYNGTRTYVLFYITEHITEYSLLAKKRRNRRIIPLAIYAHMHIYLYAYTCMYYYAIGRIGRIGPLVIIIVTNGPIPIRLPLDLRGGLPKRCKRSIHVVSRGSDFGLPTPLPCREGNDPLDGIDHRERISRLILRDILADDREAITLRVAECPVDGCEAVGMLRGDLPLRECHPASGHLVGDHLRVHIRLSFPVASPVSRGYGAIIADGYPRGSAECH